MKSVIEMLECAVLELKNQNQTEEEIFSLVNMVLRGFIKNGALTPEYISLSRQIQARKLEEAPESNILFAPTIKRSHGLIPPKN